MHRILVTGKLAPIAFEIFARESDLEVATHPDLPYAELLERIEGFDCLISRSETPVTRELIERGTRLKVIARAAVGIGNIDVAFATERGILVVNTPGMNTNSAAELTMGLMLAALRKIVLAHQSMSQLAWDRHRFSGWELRHKTLGIIGLGNVGHRVARFARGFEMNVLAYDPYLPRGVFEQHQVQQTSFEALCRQSDVITVHVPLTKETRAMLGPTQLAWMKDGVVLLNAARGGIIQEDALLRALQSGKVRCAGLDTWEVEPPRENPFRELPNVVMTPHIGASTLEAQHAVGLSIATQTLKALRGEVVDFPVNMPQLRILEGSPAKHYTVLAQKLGMFCAQYALFSPSELDVFHRGDLSESDAELIKLSFLKGFLQRTTDELVTYVNAGRKAAQHGLRIQVQVDPEGSEYESSVRFVLRGEGQRCELAGVVYGRGHIRVTRVDSFLFEMEPRGTLLVTINVDKPGMIGVIGTLLGDRGVNIDEFELARNRPGGEAMALIRVDSEASEEALAELRARDGMVSVRRVEL